MQRGLAIMVPYELKKFFTDKTTYYYLLMILTIVSFGWVFAVNTELYSGAFLVTLFLGFSVTLFTLLTQCYQSLNDAVESGSIYYNLLAIQKRSTYFLGKLISQFLEQIIFGEVVFLLTMLIFSLGNPIQTKLTISIFLLSPLMLFFLLLMWFLYYVCRLRKGTAILTFAIFLVMFFCLSGGGEGGNRGGQWSNILDIFNIFGFLKTIFSYSLSKAVSLEGASLPYAGFAGGCLLLIGVLFSRFKKIEF